MRRQLGAVLAILLVAVAFGASAQQVSPKLKDVVDHMKTYAASRPGLVSKTAQGTTYYKWIQNPPQGYEKAFFQLIEMNVGKRFLSVKLIRKTSGGTELTVLNDTDMNSSPEEAYKATGRTVQDADRAIATTSDKVKTPLTPELLSIWNATLDELKWELKAD